MKRKMILKSMTNAIAFLYAMPIFAQSTKHVPMEASMWKE